MAYLAHTFPHGAPNKTLQACKDPECHQLRAYTPQNICKIQSHRQQVLKITILITFRQADTILFFKHSRDKKGCIRALTARLRQVFEKPAPVRTESSGRFSPNDRCFRSETAQVLRVCGHDAAYIYTR